MELTDKDIDSILSNLITNSDRQRCRTQDPDNNFMLDFIDIDNFIKLIYSLLYSSDYIIAADDYRRNDPVTNKFIFTEEYPEEMMYKQNIVTVDLDRRSPASLSAGAKPFSGTTAYRPMFLGQKDDPINGGVSLDLQFMYDNGLVITCWATKKKSARMLATLFESIMNKYYWVLRKHVPIVVYEGRGETILKDNLGDLRYFGIPLNFFVRTNERFVLKERELRNIKIDYELANKGALHG